MLGLSAKSRGSAHPRVSGENLDRKADVQSALGSSPRERGKLKEQIRQGRAERLIPA